MSNQEKYPILSSLEKPVDVQQLKLRDLSGLAGELRLFILEYVSQSPGHLGSNLGAIEITVALLHAFDPLDDRIIFDVGHQAYAYKILTGRSQSFRTNRQWKGICGFPHRAESPYDAFGTGHSSTSISSALGISTAFKLAGRHNHTVAVIGDGALTGGIAFEGLNNAGTTKSDLLVILNDNNMSIDPNVGSIREYLLDISTSATYNKIRERIWNELEKPGLGKKSMRALMQKINRGFKSALSSNGNLFEALGFRYFGPIDGHNAEYVAEILTDLKRIPGPKLLHCITQKGKGYAPAEAAPTVWHAPGKFSIDTGERTKEVRENPPPKYQDVFGRTLIELMRKNESIVGITPAMPTGSSMVEAMRLFPDRTFDVGIAEQHAVTFSAGLATEGLIPYCCIYSSFMQRAYDQLVHDVALQNLHVIFCLDRAGLVGDDGATHQGAFDLAYLRHVPNITICAPMDEYEMEAMLKLAELGCGPWAIRYPRGESEGERAKHSCEDLKVGCGRKLRTGESVAILSLGTVGNEVVKACQILADYGIEATHYDMRFLKPLDLDIIDYVGEQFSTLYTVEDGAIVGGFGSAVLEAMSDRDHLCLVKRIGIPDEFIAHGSQKKQREFCQITSDRIANRIMADLHTQTSQHNSEGAEENRSLVKEKLENRI